MKTFKLLKEQILKLIEKEPDMTCFTLELYKLVVSDPWDAIEAFNDYPQCNRATASFIIQECAKKYDNWQVSAIWMNKGFSSSHEEIKDFHIVIPKNCYTLIVDSVPKVDLESMTGAFAQIEVEEKGEEPDYDGAGFSFEDRAQYANED